MQRISSSATLFLKFVLPTFWVIFFGLVTISIFFVEFDVYGRISRNTMKVGALTIYLIVGLLLWWMVARLKRVEMDEEYLYVTNYFSNLRYPYSSVSSIQEKDYLFFKTLIFTLKDKGKFGKKVACVPSQKYYEDFLIEHPKVAIQLGVKPKFD